VSARRLTWTLAVLGVLLGVGHLSFLLAAPRWALDVLWFALSGVAFIATALLNIAALRAPADRIIRWLAVGSDLVLAGFFAAAWLVLPAPQVIVGGLLFAALGALGAMPRTRAA
jgi:hypothetical protein